MQNKLSSAEIRQRFLKFFQERGHTVIPSASLVPENDPTVLFNTAGMQPLVPYLLGNPHPQGKRLVDVQKCVRTIDIDDVGDNTHATFFEMLGNWSLGDYFKADAIKWSYEFLTDKKAGLGLDPARLYVTVFEGDEAAGVPKDTESAEIWKKVGVSAQRIYFKGADSNWWPAVKKSANKVGVPAAEGGWTGPTGPCSEMFYDVTKKGLGDLTQSEYVAADEAQQVVEIWNDVFMEYEKRDGKIVGKLAQKNVDTGAGLERMAMLLQNKLSIFETDLFEPILGKIAELGTKSSGKSNAEVVKAQRIIADHIRTAVFLISDGVTPSNTDQGYILRRLLRRAVRYSDSLGLKSDSLAILAQTIIEQYAEIYPNLKSRAEEIKKEIETEEAKFRKTLEHGLKEFEKGTDAFTLFSSYGFPLELTLELAKEAGRTIDTTDFAEKMKAHQALSRAGADQKFKGGLADTSEMSVRYHTATHLLNAALRQVLGPQVSQKGSNITPERLRFDFSHTAKMTPEEIKKVEAIVNEKIAAALPVTCQEMPKSEAEKLGAVHAFGEKYGDIVKVYSVGDFSREFCGGPHVSNTKELAGPDGTRQFKIIKEEAVSAGVRRIKAVL